MRQLLDVKLKDGFSSNFYGRFPPPDSQTSARIARSVRLITITDTTSVEKS
jgi:hypothetical protein